MLPGYRRLQQLRIQEPKVWVVGTLGSWELGNLGTWRARELEENLRYLGSTNAGC